MNEIVILTIEDDEVDREMIRKSLTIFSANLVEAKTGVEGLEKIREKEFNLILLDYKLPDIDGMTMILKIREITETPIIVVTGFGNEDLVKATAELGVLDYIPKNKITPEFLTRTIINDLLIYKTQKENKIMEKALHEQREQNIRTLSQIIEMAKAKLAEYDVKTPM